MAVWNIGLGFSTSKGKRALRGLRGEADKTGRSFRLAGSGVRQFKKHLVGIGISAAGLGLLLRSIIKTGMSFQGLRVQLETVSGTAQAAEKNFEWIKGFAEKTPHQVDQITAAFLNLKAKGFEPLPATMQAISDMAAGMGKDILTAAQAVTSAAFGEAEMLKQWGIVMTQQGEKVKIRFRGVTTEVKKDSQEIFNVLTKLAKTHFEGAGERLSKTLEGRLSTLSDKWKSLADSIARAGLIDLLTDLVVVATGLLGKMNKAFGDTGFTISNFVADVQASIVMFTSVVVRNWTGMQAGIVEGLGRMIGKVSLALRRAPWIIRKMIDPTGSGADSGIAIGLDLLQAADAIREWGDALSETFADASVILLKTKKSADAAAKSFDNLAKSGGAGGGGGLELTKKQLKRIKEITELWKGVLKEAEREARKLAKQFEEMVDNLESLSVSGASTALPLLPEAGAIKRFFDRLKAGFREVAEDFAFTLQDAFRQIALSLLDALMQVADVFAEALINGGVSFADAFSGIGRQLGGQIGQAIGAAFGPAGAVLGNVLGQVAGDVIGKTIGKLLDGLFGSSNKTVGSVTLGGKLGGQAVATGGFDLTAHADWLELQIRTLEEIIGGSLRSMGRVVIDLKRKGEIFVTVFDEFGKQINQVQFSDIHKAKEFALSAWLSFAEISGDVALAFREIIANSTADIEQLFADLDFVRGLPGQLLGLGDAKDRAQLAISSVLHGFDLVRAQIANLGLSLEAAAPLLERVAIAERKRIAELRLDVLDQLAGWAKQFGKNAEFVRRIEVMKVKIQFAIIRAQLVMLGIFEEYKNIWRELRGIAIDAAKASGATAENLGAAAVSLGRISGSVASVGGAAGSGGSPKDKWEAVREALAALNSIAAPTDAFNQVEEAYRRVLEIIEEKNFGGPGKIALRAQAAEAYAAALERVRNQMLDTIRAFRESLDLGQFAVGTPAEKAALAMERFRESLQAALSGDPEALAKINDLAQSALGLTADAFGTSTEQARDFFDEVMSGLDALIGTGAVGASGGPNLSSMLGTLDSTAQEHVAIAKAQKRILRENGVLLFRSSRTLDRIDRRGAAAI